MEQVENGMYMEFCFMSNTTAEVMAEYWRCGVVETMAD